METAFKIALFLLPFLLWGQVNSNGDFQIWDRVVLQAKMSRDWAFSTELETRFGDNASKLFLYYAQGQFIYHPVSWFDIAPVYRQVVRRYPDNSNQWQLQYYPFIENNLYIPIYNWEFTVRNRLVYSVFLSDPSHWIYRGRYRLILPCRFTSMQIAPFFDNEIFIRERHGFDEDRVSAGFLFHFLPYLSSDLFYMCRFREQADGHWIHQNILYLILRFRL